MRSLVIPGRFNGPPTSANGGYTCGVLAELSHFEPVTVQLRKPPPLEDRLQKVPTDSAFELRCRDEVVAVAMRHGPATWTALEPVPLEWARAAEATYPGLSGHPFPTCFACGPEREPGDGLRIFPGRIDDDRVAATWTPAADLAGDDGLVSVPVTWAALDCVGGWSSDLEHRPLVLGQMAARILTRPTPGTTYVVVGQHLRTEGRKTWTASALFDEEGELLGQAEHLWIAVDWAVLQSEGAAG